MGLFNKVLILGILSVGVYFLSLEKEFTWEMNQPLKEENQSKALSLMESFEFFKFHPFYISHNQKSFDEKTKVRTFELKERLDLGPYQGALISEGKFWPIGKNSYALDVMLNILDTFPCKFYSEFTITKNDIKEKVKVSGPLFVSFIVWTAAHPEHIKMLKLWAEAK